MANVSSYDTVWCCYYWQKGTGYEIDTRVHSYENWTLTG